MNQFEKKQLHIGLIGFGSMGKAHTFAVRNLPAFYGELPFTAKTWGICTRHPENSAKIADEYDIPRVFSSAEELIRCPEIDIVDICTPNDSHFELLKTALASDKHVLCEKPLCTNRQDAVEIASLSSGNRRTCGIVFNYRRMAPVMRAKQLIDQGKIGDILSFRGFYLHSSATDISRPAGWKQNREICGGGVLFDLGSHVLDLLAYLCGRFVRVSGKSQIAYPTRKGADGTPWKTNAEEAFYLMGETATGAHGTVSVGKIQLGTNDDLGFEIYGTKGSLCFSLMEPDWLCYYDGTQPDAPIGGLRGFTRIECIGKYPDLIFPSPKAPAGWLYGHVAAMHDYLCAVAEEKPFAPSFEDGAYVQSAMDAAYRSDRLGCALTEVTL